MKNQTVLITGASSGIGYELAKIYAQNGYNLVLVARREEKMKELKEKFPSVGIKVITKDLSIDGSCEELNKELGDEKIDILVNNAGFGDKGSFETLNKDLQLSMIDLNIKALTELTHIFGSKMVKRGSGKILNVSSVVGFFAVPSMATYSATKAYVLSFGSSLSKEWRKKGVTVMTLCPGPTNTGFQDAIDKNNQTKNTKPLPSSNVSAYQVALSAYNQINQEKLVNVYGLSNKITVLASKLTPREIFLSILDKMFS